MGRVGVRKGSKRGVNFLIGVLRGRGERKERAVM